MFKPFGNQIYIYTHSHFTLVSLFCLSKYTRQRTIRIHVHLLYIFQDKINFTLLLLYTFLLSVLFSFPLPCLSRPFVALFLSLRLDRSENDGRLAPRVKGKASGRLHGGGRSTRSAERRGTQFETTLSSVRNAFAVSPAPASICPSPFLSLSTALPCRAANLLTLFVMYKSKIKIFHKYFSLKFCIFARVFKYILISTYVTRILFVLIIAN